MACYCRICQTSLSRTIFPACSRLPIEQHHHFTWALVFRRWSNTSFSSGLRLASTAVWKEGNRKYYIEPWLRITSIDPVLVRPVPPTLPCRFSITLTFHTFAKLIRFSSFWVSLGCFCKGSSSPGYTDLFEGGTPFDSGICLMIFDHSNEWDLLRLLSSIISFKNEREEMQAAFIFAGNPDELTGTRCFVQFL